MLEQDDFDQVDFGELNLDGVDWDGVYDMILLSLQDDNSLLDLQELGLDQDLDDPKTRLFLSELAQRITGRSPEEDPLQVFRQAAEERDMNMGELGRAVGVSTDEMYRFFQDGVARYPELADRLARYFGIER